jgi:hypothetical protein
MKRLLAILICLPLNTISCIVGLLMLITAGVPRVILDFLCWQQGIARGESQTFREVWDLRWEESITKHGLDLFLHPSKF